MASDPIELRLSRREIDLAQYRHRSVAADDCSLVQHESALIFDAATRELVIVYLVLNDDCRDVETAVQRINYMEGTRASGMRSRARVFGNQPRSLPRRDFCNSASLSREDPAANEIISAYADKVATYYEQYNPDRYAKHAATTERVLPEWRLKKSPFTSGIVNRNNPLPYHFDSGNFADVWSNMLVFKRGITGGYLAVPQYDVAFALPNNSLLMFDGQGLLHGVTPFTMQDENSYRYSIVYYSLKQMWQCLPITEEVIRAQKRRADREYRRYEEGLARTGPDVDRSAHSQLPSG